jgi:hypothetical protein
MQTGCVAALIEVLARFPKLGGAFGLLAAVAFGFLGITSWHELQEMPETPEQLTLSAAIARVTSGEEIWVEVEQVEWDCQNIVYSGSGSDTDTEIVFTDEPRSVLGVAQFERRLTYEEIAENPTVGVLRSMSDGFYERLPNRGFDLTEYENVDARLYLCTYCGRGNSTLGVICGVVLVPLGLLMYPLCLIMRKQYEKKGML